MGHVNFRRCIHLKMAGTNLLEGDTCELSRCQAEHQVLLFLQITLFVVKQPVTHLSILGDLQPCGELPTWVLLIPIFFGLITRGYFGQVKPLFFYLNYCKYTYTYIYIYTFFYYLYTII